MTENLTNILLGLQSAILVVVWYFFRQWMNRVDATLLLLATKEAQDKENTKLAESIGKLWRRANNHTHQALCHRAGESCHVEVGKVVIGAGGDE